MMILKLIKMKTELNVLSKLIHFSKCCLISDHLYDKILLSCIFYKKKIYINYHFRFVNCCPIFLYHSLFFFSVISFYDTGK